MLKAKSDKLSTENKEFCEKQVKAGKLLPAMKESVLSFMEDLSTLGLEFSEENTALASFKALISQLPAAVNFSEVTPPAKDETPQTASDIADKARAFQEKQAEAGHDIRFSEAVRAVCK